MGRDQRTPATDQLIADLDRVLDLADPVPDGLADRIGRAAGLDTLGGGDRWRHNRGRGPSGSWRSCPPRRRRCARPTSSPRCGRGGDDVANDVETADTTTATGDAL
jgi:hypothetical protein